MKKVFSRFIELDIWRGICVIGMIVFHVFFLLDYFQIYKSKLFSGWWYFFGQMVRISFLLLVGISMVISYRRILERGGYFFNGALRQIRRGLYVLLAAMLVSLATYFFAPLEFVRFGILHLIAVSIFVLSFLVNRGVVNLIVGVAVIFIGQFWQWPVFIPSLDNFAIFPWMGVVALGIALANFTYDWRKKVVFSLAKWKFLNKHFLVFMLRSILFLGRYSLPIYLLHIPLILLAMWLLGFINF